ncbi:hypothetical protein AMET1_1283 [Methanonatronarchaeum thermophilum]|uniref:Uncharacterized protein n=1 Tax=Methanonatronarchaeum thermophilum TaxID=1927129 RepID=A0A1Y3GAU8_9EURY|nr:hypothetical protein AMET1_1283 [Methanonatronarchaeum thermophilum]
MLIGLLILPTSYLGLKTAGKKIVRKTNKTKIYKNDSNIPSNNRYKTDSCNNPVNQPQFTCKKSKQLKLIPLPTAS